MMDPVERDALEERIHAHCEAGDKKGAATLLLDTYGRELLGFLISRLRDRVARPPPEGVITWGFLRQPGR